MDLWVRLLAGLGLGILIAGLAYKAGALSRSGFAAAAVDGMLVFGLGGLPAAVLLLAFFISSSALSRLIQKRKDALADRWEKGSRRDAGQVLANGGLAAAFMIAHTVFPQAAWPWAGFAGSLAAVNADTWATELGVFSPETPRLVTTWKRVEAGTSGAVTMLGTVASLAGAGLIAVLAALVLPVLRGWGAGLGVAVSGLLGSLVDSGLGASLQAVYWCPVCAKETERSPVHRCGNPVVFRRGLRWMNNDRVNLVCAAAGAVVAVALVG